MRQAGANSPGVGFLYPGYAAEDDFPRLATAVQPPVRAEVVHTTIGEDAHRVDALRDMGGISRLREGALALAGHGVSSAVWSSTSASFVFGWEGAKKQAATLVEELGVPASTTALAFVTALGAIGASRVAVVATYPEDIANLFRQFLNHGGIEVLQIKSQGIMTATEVGTLGRDEVLEMVAGNDHEEAEALLVPDTALHTAAWIEDIEGTIGKPVLTANQVTFWEALRLAGHLRLQDGLGTLFRARKII